MDCSPPGSSVYGISQASTLECVAISFSRGSSWLRDLWPLSHSWSPINTFLLVGGWWNSIPGKVRKILLVLSMKRSCADSTEAVTQCSCAVSVSQVFHEENFPSSALWLPELQFFPIMINLQRRTNKVFFFFKEKNWTAVDLQCCVSFRNTAKWFSYICVSVYIYILFFSIIAYYKILNIVPCAL